MEKILEKKRERKEEKEESSEDITVGELWKRIKTYHKETLKRILEKSKSVQPPPGKGVTKDCQLYDGGDTNSTYARIWFNGKPEMVHRVTLMISLGVNLLPEFNNDRKKLECAHKCDNPRCCEPSHLYLATKEQNSEDRIRNGLLRGTKHHNAKIEAEIAQEIKWSKGYVTKIERADEFGVTLGMVKNIDRNIAWWWLPDRDGNIFQKQNIKFREQRKIDRKVAKETPWTKKQLDMAQIMFNDPAYVKIDTENMFPKENGTYCRLWIRSITSGGYPQTTIGPETIGAHILACTIGNNYIRPKDLQAAHDCGNKLCVNSKHLSFKPSKENTIDKFKHGTIQVKYPFETIIDIRKRCDNGESQSSVAELYNINVSYVSQIVGMKKRIYG